MKVAVVQQNEDGDIGCLQRLCDLLEIKHASLPKTSLDVLSCAQLRRQVRVYEVEARHAKGPVFARAMGSRMVSDDASFCMQVAPSHLSYAVASAPLTTSFPGGF